MNKQLFDLSTDLLQALLWQHNNAPRITALLRLKQHWYSVNQEDFWQAWIRDVFDLRTANEFGLKVWSLILGIPINMVVDKQTKDNFGFGNFNLNFNNGNFGTAGSGTARLTPDNARLVLRLRYFQLICRPTVPEINKFLAYLFKGQGMVYCSDGNNMQYIVYYFNFAPGSELIEILRYYDVLPRPAAVGVQVVITGKPAFGFGPYNINFDNAPFANDRS